jgi:hypothetical protein
VHELHELARAGANLADLRRLLDGVEVEPDVVHTTTGWTDNRVEVFEAVDEQRFGGRGVLLTSAVCHRLPATGLIGRIFDRAPEPLEELQRVNADLWEHRVDVTGNEECDFHRCIPPSGEADGELPVFVELRMTASRVLHDRIDRRACAVHHRTSRAPAMVVEGGRAAWRSDRAPRTC